MKRTLSKMIASIIALMLVLTCIPASANTVSDVRWVNGSSVLSLSNTPNGYLPTVDCTELNTVTVKFDQKTTTHTTLTVVPVVDGVVAEPTVENTVFLLQQESKDGVVEFTDFQFKPGMKNGVYAAIIGGTKTEYVTRYFKVDAVIELETENGPVILSESPNAKHNVFDPSLNNKVRITYQQDTKGTATLIVVPVVDGVPSVPTPENVMLLLQEEVSDNSVEFDFRFRPSIPTGEYALYAGVNGNAHSARYFEVNANYSPKLIGGDTLQYDSYKESITLRLDASNGADIKEWAAQKAYMVVTLSNGETSVDVHNDDFEIDAAAGTVTIKTTDCADVFPAFGASVEGNIQKINVSITTMGYWGDTEVGGARNAELNLIAPEVSSEGFARGVPFEITLYSDNALSDVRPIIAIYDDDMLVASVFSEAVELEAGVEKTVPITLQCLDVKPSGKFSVKVMLWQGTEITPLTSIVKFP